MHGLHVAVRMIEQRVRQKLGFAKIQETKRKLNCIDFRQSAIMFGGCLQRKFMQLERLLFFLGCIPLIGGLHIIVDMFCGVA